MAEQFGTASPPKPFEYELFDGDPDHLRTVNATPAEISPWIDPSKLNLKHRIGRGPFGDVWLATHHQSADDYEEYHEVAVKMLYPIKEDHMQAFLNKLEDAVHKCRRLQRVCWLHGISIKNGKICVAMKFYNGSLSDRMATLKGGKLPVLDVLRYGIDLAKGIQELHSIDVLVLNLKPSNLLLNDQGQAIIGDFGIPHLLLGIPLPDSDTILRLGSPNYMAPEQWEPEIRGPISYETDVWGFGCTIVEMLNGTQPWFGRSIKEIFNSVVLNQEKPHIPDGLPPAVETILHGCFEYDLRNRPLIPDILLAFESGQKSVNTDGDWMDSGSRTLPEKLIKSDPSTWFLSRDHFEVGDLVHSRKPPNSRKPQKRDFLEGTVVGLEKETDRDGFVLVRTRGTPSPLRVHVSSLKRVTHGLAVGDWVSLKSENRNHLSLGILHSIERDGRAAAGFLGLETLWKGNCSDIQKAKGYYVGQFVKLRQDVVSPRFDWPHKRGEWDTGRISQVLPNGCLVVNFPGRFVLGDEPKSFMADPAETELVSFDTCPGVIKKYQHMEDFHWAVRPLVIAFGLFTAVKLGIFAGKTVSAKFKGCRGSKKQVPGDSNTQDNKAGWLPTPVANVIYRESSSFAPVR